MSEIENIRGLLEKAEACEDKNFSLEASLPISAFLNNAARGVRVLLDELDAQRSKYALLDADFQAMRFAEKSRIATLIQDRVHLGPSSMEKLRDILGVPQLTFDCGHDSADGIDQTDLSDPEKIWHCNQCGVLFRSIPDADCIHHDVPLTDDEVAALGNASAIVRDDDDQ